MRHSEYAAWLSARHRREAGFAGPSGTSCILSFRRPEEKPVPELFEREVLLLKEKGVFDAVNGVLVGKPQDEAFYQEYKDILIKSQTVLRNLFSLFT